MNNLFRSQKEKDYLNHVGITRTQQFHLKCESLLQSKGGFAIPNDPFTYVNPLQSIITINLRNLRLLFHLALSMNAGNPFGIY